MLDGAFVVIPSTDVSFVVTFPLITFSSIVEFWVTPSLGKTIGVPDVISIGNSVDDVEFCEIVSFLLVSLVKSDSVVVVVLEVVVVDSESVVDWVVVTNFSVVVGNFWVVVVSFGLVVVNFEVVGTF